MGHDHAADQAGRHAPARGVAEFQVAAVALVADVLGAGEAGAQIVRGAGLQRLAVLHHRFNGIGGFRAGEAFVLGLLAGDHRHGEHGLGELPVHFQRLKRGGQGVLAADVGGMPLLPEEFRSAQEQARAHLPADHIGPLVDLHRQVPIALDPTREGVADDRLRGRADDQGLFQLGVGIGLQLAVDVLQPVVGDHRHFLGEAFDVFSFLGEEAERDEQREVGVIDAHLLDAAIHGLLNALPDPIAPWLDDHGPTHRADLGHVRLADDGLIPVGESRLVAGHPADAESSLHRALFKVPFGDVKAVAQGWATARRRTPVSIRFGRKQ